MANGARVIEALTRRTEAVCPALEGQEASQRQRRRERTAVRPDRDHRAR